MGDRCRWPPGTPTTEVRVGTPRAGAGSLNPAPQPRDAYGRVVSRPRAIESAAGILPGVRSGAGSPPFEVGLDRRLPRLRIDLSGRVHAFRQAELAKFVAEPRQLRVLDDL